MGCAVKILPISAIVLAGFVAVPVSASTVTAVWTGTVSSDDSGNYAAGEAATLTFVYDTSVGTSGGARYGTNDPIQYASVDIAGTTTTLLNLDYGFVFSSNDADPTYHNRDIFQIYAVDDYYFNSGTIYSYSLSGSAIGQQYVDSFDSSLSSAFSIAEGSGLLAFKGCLRNTAVDDTNGDTTYISETCFSFDSLVVSEYSPTAPVPLPASALLLTGALAGLGGLRQLRRRKSV